MASAFALGQDGLRLRSRRNRSGRSHRLSNWSLVVVIAIGIGVGVVGAKLYGMYGTRPVAAAVPAVEAATLDRQRFVAELQPVRAKIEGSVAQEGLLVAQFQGGQIDKKELQRQLTDVLAKYRDAAGEVNALDPPPAMRSSVQAYAQAVAGLAQSGTELSKAYDDGDQARVSAALADSLQALAKLHDVADTGALPRD